MSARLQTGGRIGFTRTLPAAVFLASMIAARTCPAPDGMGIDYWSENTEFEAKLCSDVGSKWSRPGIPWYAIEPTPGAPMKWSTWDARISLMNAHGMDGIAMFGWSPAWMHDAVLPAGAVGFGPLKDSQLDRFANIIRAIAERYDGDGIDDAPGSPLLRIIALWNEEDHNQRLLPGNGGGLWGSDDLDQDGVHDSVEYARMCKVAFEACAAAYANNNGRGIRVGLATGGLLYEPKADYNDDPARAQTNPTFFPEVLDEFQRLGGFYLDYVNVHHYWYTHGLWDRYDAYSGDLVGKTAFMKTELKARGFSGVKFSMDEMGHYLGNVAWGGGPDDHPYVENDPPEDVQARVLLKRFTRFLAHRDDFKVCTWFLLRSTGTLGDGGMQGYGLMQPPAHFGEASAPRESYRAFDSLAKALDGFVIGWEDVALGDPGPVEGYVFYNPADPSQRREAVWSRSRGSVDVPFPAGQVTRVSKLGESRTIADGSSDDVGAAGDGRVTLRLDWQPVIVEWADARPLPPANLSLRVVSPSAVRLRWSAPSANETGFRISRKDGATGTWRKIAEVGPDVAVYTDKALAAGVTYGYKVRSFNAAGQSVFCREASAAPAAPARPAGLVAKALPNARVFLSWTDTAANEKSFKIRRKAGADGTYAEIATVGADVTTYEDRVVSSSTEYHYRVCASNGAGDSGWSAEAVAVSPRAAPSAPASLTAYPTSPTQVVLAWADTAADETGFRIERRIGTANAWAEVARVGANVTTYANAELTSGWQYFFRVRAFNEGGDSAYSGDVQATPK